MVSVMTQQQIPEGYKQTEVGVIPEDWGIQTIDALTSIVGDGIHATPIYSSSGEYYFINGNNIDNGKITVTENTKRVDSIEYAKHKKLLTDRTIFLSINGTIGNLAFYNQEPVVLGKSAAYFNIKNNYSKYYVFYSLQTSGVNQYFEDGLTGTTIKNLGLGTIRSTPIPIPKIEKEQTAIANALSDVDALIASLEKMIDKKSAIKTAAMQQLLTGKKRLPPFDQQHTGYQQTELGEIPEDWDVVSIEKAIERRAILDQMDGNHGELYPKSHEFSDFGIPYVGATDFNNGRVDFSSCKYLPVSRAKLFKKGIAKKGDVLFAHNATVGPVALLDTDFEFVILSTTATYYRCDNCVINNKYLASYFSSQIFVNQYSSVMSQSTRNQVPILTQRKFYLVLPSIEEQVVIAGVLSDMDSEINVLEQRLNKSQKIKQGMMQELLTGKTRLV